MFLIIQLFWATKIIINKQFIKHINAGTEKNFRLSSNFMLVHWPDYLDSLIFIMIYDNAVVIRVVRSNGC